MATNHAASVYVGTRYAVMLGSVVHSARGKAKARAQYSFSLVSIWDIVRELGYSTVSVKFFIIL